ncbi:hypothetical protein [Methylobacterium nigriterrae]|uniref:hypothetical protein n=1 Tax=Methylobacterium nigriterrae TaxID=3127512 RepID=UPI00301410CC
MAEPVPNDWASVFHRVVVSLILGLPFGGLLFAATGLVLAIWSGDPILQHPLALALRTALAAVAYTLLGGFAWTPETGYHSLHAWYAAGIVLTFVLLSKPWRRGADARRPRPTA